MSFTSYMQNLYDKQYKKLLIPPLIVIILCLAIVGYHWASTGEIVSKGVSLKGGISLSVQLQEEVDVSEIQHYLQSSFPSSDISVRSLTRAGNFVGIVVDATDLQSTDIIPLLEKRFGTLSKDKYSVDSIGPSLGQSFFKEAIISVIIAFVFMSIVIFIYFRALVPSSYVVLAAIADMLFALAIVDLFDVKLSTAGVAAFLMLIGYSVDTDILLTTRVLKRTEGTVPERMAGVIGTGLTMTIAAMVATVVAYFATQSETMKQIMFILFWGLVADIFNTWLTNAGLLRWYTVKKSEKEHHG